MRDRLPRSSTFIARLTALAILGSAAPNAGAATIEWNNAAGGNWSAASNWTPPSVPGAGDDVLITLAGTYTVTLDVDATINWLSLGGAGGTQTLAASGRTLGLNDASVVNPAGVIALTTCTLNGPGGVTNQGLANLRSCVVNAPLVNQGTLDLRANNSLNGAFTNAAGGTLHVEAEDTWGNATATVASGFTNSGTIELKSSGTASWSAAATLNVTAGTLVNAPGGTIVALAGTGYARTLGAQLDNQGTVTAAYALTLARASAAHSNSGTIQQQRDDRGQRRRPDDQPVGHHAELHQLGHADGGRGADAHGERRDVERERGHAGWRRGAGVE
ncbi:MAG: hypothetical protein HZC42_12145 [Candidatus Eisenbacteria bacterium]|nr:hypothetical protein [Candidatus Eisenbacteria bacterium]